jgi:NAD(P)-dependent dehydrogenase (short-subunit alcohol dehydrogenase family)
MRLADKVAIITGAGKGIGRAIAQRFAAEGAMVVAVERDADALHALAGALAPGRLIAVTGDATSQALIDATVQRVLAAHARIDILVNNAIEYSARSVVDTTDDAWAATLDSGLTGVFRWCRAVLPAMSSARRGSIVNLASVNQLVANPGLAAYTAAKGGVHALTKQIAVEYGPHGIRCNAISPGLIVTERTAEGRSAGDYVWDIEAHPIGRVGEPYDVANAVLFLASDEAGFITGVDLPVDGGLTSLSPSALVSPRLRAGWGRRPIAHVG